MLLTVVLQTPQAYIPFAGPAVGFGTSGVFKFAVRCNVCIFQGANHTFQCPVILESKRASLGTQQWGPLGSFTGEARTDHFPSVSLSQEWGEKLTQPHSHGSKSEQFLLELLRLVPNLRVHFLQQLLLNFNMVFRYRHTSVTLPVWKCVFINIHSRYLTPRTPKY